MTLSKASSCYMASVTIDHEEDGLVQFTNCDVSSFHGIAITYAHAQFIYDVLIYT